MRDNRHVPSRRFLLFAVLLIAALWLVTAIVPRERRSDDSSAGGAPSTAASAPASMVEASLPADDDVRARVGNVVRLTVSAPATDVVELVSLGIEEPVDAGVPTEIVFVADRVGRFRVRLRDAGQAVGTIDVAS